MAQAAYKAFVEVGGDAITLTFGGNRPLNQSQNVRFANPDALRGNAPFTGGSRSRALFKQFEVRTGFSSRTNFVNFYNHRETRLQFPVAGTQGAGEQTIFLARRDVFLLVDGRDIELYTTQELGNDVTSISMIMQYREDYEIIKASSYSIDLSTNILDSTAFNKAGIREKKQGLIDCQVTLGGFAGGFGTLREHINSDEIVHLHITTGGGDGIAAGFKVESDSRGGGFDDLETQEVSLTYSDVFADRLIWIDKTEDEIII